MCDFEVSPHPAAPPAHLQKTKRRTHRIKMRIRRKTCARAPNGKRRSRRLHMPERPAALSSGQLFPGLVDDCHGVTEVVEKCLRPDKIANNPSAEGAAPLVFDITFFDFRKRRGAASAAATCKSAPPPIVSPCGLLQEP